VATVLTEKTNKNKIYLNKKIQNTVQTIQNTVHASTHNIKIDIKDLGWNNIALWM
jgi:hypothetical protein